MLCRRKTAVISKQQPLAALGKQWWDITVSATQDIPWPHKQILLSHMGAQQTLSGDCKVLFFAGNAVFFYNIIRFS